MKKFLTTPIYYANGRPHIGHACTSVIVDITKRSLIMQGHEVFFSTGLDEHGQKNQAKIEQSGVLAKDYFDNIASDFKDLFKQLDINYDAFIETTDEKHKKTVRYVLDLLNKKGDFFKKFHEGKYCVGCEQFKEDSELDENGCCPDHKVKPIDYKEENYFFNLDSKREWLKGVLASDTFLTDIYRKEMINLVKDGIPDLCISRPKDRVWLGIEIPFDTNFVTFVWFDALINYLTVIGYPENENYKDWWQDVTHFLAKDIVKPHSIYWPIMLHEMGVNPPTRELVHGYLTNAGDKMGKSLGNGLNPYKVIEIFGSDSLRWMLARIVNKNDADLNYDILLNTFNNDLANVIGNAFYRTYSMCKKSFIDGLTPAENFGEDELALLNNIKELLQGKLPKGESIEEFASFTKDIVSAFRLINGFIDKMAPWAVADVDRKNQILLATLEAIRICFENASIIMPNASKKVFDAIGVVFDNQAVYTIETKKIKTGFKLIEVEPLFLRMKADELSEKLKG